MITRFFSRGLYVFLWFVFSFPVFAEIIVENPNETLIPNFWGGNVTNGIGTFIEYAVGIASVLGVIGITWGGIQMMMAAWEEEKMKKARWIIQYSLIGTALAAWAYGIISFVANINF